jgi:hypothetical protein
LHAHAVITTLRTLAQHCKRLSPLLAAPAALLLSQAPAKAILTYNIFESGGNVVVQASGSLDLTGANPFPFPFGPLSCGYNGVIVSASANICTGPDINLNAYTIVGPTSFNGTVNIEGASSATGTSTSLGGVGLFGIDTAYTSNTPIVSSSTFNGTTLAALGFTTTGLIGTWTLDGTSESIQVFLGPQAASVPGPLPLLGAGAAFGWSRRLRKRIATPLSTPPQV